MSPPALRRELGVFGAVLMGLGSIVGTGIFVSVGTAAGIAGPLVVLATVLAAGVATCNGLSSAQLAASHPVSGGTYEYGYRYLSPHLGFVAGWLFLLAKSASAATAALGFAGYGLELAGGPAGWRVPIAGAVVVAIALLVLGGIRRSNAANIVIVSITLLVLLAFVVIGAPHVSQDDLQLFPNERSGDLLHATALMFVAYTGYGRIATLGEEVRDPARTIPRAIVTTLVVSMLLYVAVAVVGVGTAGADALAAGSRTTAAPLEVAARSFGVPALAELLAIGATLAMIGVLLNLVLGLSRVLLAMGRRGDVPLLFASVSERSSTPVPATIAVSALILGLVTIGNVKTTWSFSAFTVLVYYAITNLAALRQPKEERRFPRVVPVLGLLACAFLAFWVERRIWWIGLALIAGGLVLRQCIRPFTGAARSKDPAGER